MIFFVNPDAQFEAMQGNVTEFRAVPW